LPATVSTRGRSARSSSVGSEPILSAGRRA